jgi:hypothetical protein
MRRLLFVLASTLALGACHSSLPWEQQPTGPWEKSNTTSDQAQQDRLACEVAARKVLQQNARITQDISASQGSNSGYGLPLSGTGGSTLAQNMTQYSYDRNKRNLVDDCMQGRGYQIGQ